MNFHSAKTVIYENKRKRHREEDHHSGGRAPKMKDST